MRKAYLAAICAAGMLTAAGGAKAAIMMAVYEGSITDPTSVDTTGVFGAAGASLVGHAFTTTYLYDTSLGGFIPFGNSAELGFERSGGTGPLPAFGPLFDPTSPMINASLLINGVTVSLGGSYAGLDFRFGGATSDIAHGAADDPANFFLNDIGGISGVPIDGDLPFFASGVSGLSAEFHYQVVDPETSELTSGFLLKGTDRTISVSCVSACPAAVPEPASWALMLAGFFGLGGALRARRKLVGYESATA